MTAVRRIFLCSILLVLLATGAGAGLDATEERMLATIEARRPAALALIERTVNVNSGTLNAEGVRAVGAMMREEFTGLGFATRWIDGEEFGRAGHLVATHGDRGPHFLLIGHLDTVFEPDSPFQSWELVGDHFARGPGSTDMKGGNVIILEALHALAAAGVLDSMQFTVFLTGDEERSGRPLDLARADLIAAADAADWALGFEDGDGDPRTAVIARRGSSKWTLEVTGTAAHSSQVFSESVGYGAIYELARILDGFRSELAGEDLLTFNPGMVVGGTDATRDEATSSGRAYGKPNVVAATALATGDLRTISPGQFERARERMQAIVADSLPGTAATLRFQSGYPPLAPTDGNRELLALYDEASRDLGFGPVSAVDPARAGAADVSFCSGRVQGALCGLGLMGTGGHTLEEIADLRTLVPQTARAALLMWRLSQR